MKIPTNPRPFVFVLMPFGEEFDDTYKLAIKPACERAGAYAERVDEQIFQGSILERIYNQIAKADIVIADLTGRNPNVFYETGYAHALGKLTLLLTRKAEDIPFDLKHYSHIVYEGRLSDLLSQLKKRVHWHLENPERKQFDSSIFGVRVNNIILAGVPCIDVPISSNQAGFDLRVDLHNVIWTEMIRTVQCQIGLFTSKYFVSSSTKNNPNNVVSFSEDKNLHLPGLTISLLPAGWETVKFAVQTSNVTLNPKEIYEFTIRIFSDSGFVDFPFSVLLSAAQSE